MDINAIFRPIVYQPGLFGFKNSADAAFNLNAPVVPFSNPVFDPNDYVFWDGFHPTTKVHHFAAQFIYISVFLNATSTSFCRFDRRDYWFRYFASTRRYVATVRL